MPTYDYRCTACGQSFGIRQTMAEDALTVHPKCQDPKCHLEKQVSRFYGSVSSVSRSHTGDQGPMATPLPAPADPVHVCSKYCDFHKSPNTKTP